MKEKELEKELLVRDGYSETYINVCDLTLSEIEEMIQKNQVTKDNAIDILDRVYEITDELPEERWGETTSLKRILRKIKKS